MTDFDSSARDELVAAYLDDEASQDERAQVEADPELLALVEVHREIADMVADPVVPPDTAVRNSHIAAALQASATAPNVTSLTTHKRRWTPQYTRVLGAAAAVAVVLFAGTLFVLTNDNDDDTAASVSTTAPASAADADGASSDLANSAPLGDGGRDAEDAPAPEPAPEPAEAPAPADALAEEAAEAPAEAPQAAGEDDAGDGADAGSGRLLAEVPVRSHAPQPDLDALVAEVSETTDEFRLNAQSFADFFATEFTCSPQLESLAAEVSPDTSLLFVGEATVAGEVVEYVVFEDVADTTMVVLETSSCGIVDTVTLQ